MISYWERALPAQNLIENKTTKTVNPSVKVASCNIIDLFKNNIGSGIQGILCIPEYQRPFLWGEKEISQLLKELEGYANNQSIDVPDYYLGSIILHQAGMSLAIIDGQQRLTTMGIVAAILSGENVCKISYTSPISLQNIASASVYIRKVLKDNNIIYQIIERINVTIIATSSEDDAYTFFETQNSAGVRLRGIDIVKAFHLRSISGEIARSNYAVTWEAQHDMDSCSKLLLKARYWDIIRWRDVPGRKDDKGTKSSVIDEFSTRTKDNPGYGYQLARFASAEYNQDMQLPEYLFSARQPLANGANAIDYFVCLSGIHHLLFTEGILKQSHPKVNDFFRAVIDIDDGTIFLRDLYKATLMCYVSRFGKEQLTDASFWLFRMCYSLRVSNDAVREDAVPSFLKKYPVLDFINTCYSHLELIELLKCFEITVVPSEAGKNTRKSRFIGRVADYFGFPPDPVAFDKNLVSSFKKFLHEKG